MRRALRDNGLAIAACTCFLLGLIGQGFTGHRTYDREQGRHGQPMVGFVACLAAGHFLEATLETGSRSSSGWGCSSF